MDEEKDLGIKIDSTCTPSKQVSAAALKGNQVLGQLLRTFTYRDRYTFIKLYKQYVRPHLECCIQAWSPWLQQDVDLLENVQKRAVKAISGLTGTYEEKLKSLKMLSLEDRRRRGDMIETFKLVHGFENVDSSKFFSFSHNNHHHATRQATVVTESSVIPVFGLSQGPSKLELRRNFFTQRVVAPWNALPAKVKTSKTVDAFKVNYDNALSV